MLPSYFRLRASQQWRRLLIVLVAVFTLAGAAPNAPQTDEGPIVPATGASTIAPVPIHADVTTPKALSALSAL